MAEYGPLLLGFAFILYLVIDSLKNKGDSVVKYLIQQLFELYKFIVDVEGPDRLIIRKINLMFLALVVVLSIGFFVAGAFFVQKNSTLILLLSLIGPVLFPFGGVVSKLYTFTSSW